MKKQIFLTSIMLILVVTLFSLILIGGADLFKKDKGLIKISKQKFEWKIISQEKDLYKVEIADKLKKDTEICFYKKDAKSLSDLDNEVEIKNKDGTCIKDKEKGKDCIKLPKKAVTKEKEKYGYCYTNKEIEYLSFNPIVVWQEISAVDYYYNDINISTTLERCDEFRENCGIAYPSVLIVDSEKLKFGAEDLESKVDSNYHYSFKSNKPFYKDNQGYYVQLDKLNSISNFFGITDTYEISRIDVNDICTSLYEGSEENITEIFNPNCQLNTYSVEIGNETYLDEITNETIYTSIYTYYLDVYFTGFYNSTEDRIFIDPLYTIAQTDVFASGNILNNVTVEANFSHLDVNDQIDTNGINWSSLVAYYPFDVDSGTTTYDYTGNNNDGTYIGGALSNSTCGLYGNGGCFDGDSDYIALAGTAVDGVNPINLNESFAISFWINFADSRSTYLINNYEGVSPYTGNSILIHADPRNSKNFIRVHVDDNVHSTDPNGGTDLLLNTWYHVTAVRYKGDNVSIFINGNLDGSAVDITTGSVLSTRDWKIGSRANSPTEEEFKGKMDEVIFFNTSLTSQQIQDIYNNQSQRFKSQGTQTLKQINISSGYNQINLTTSFNAFIGSNISARIGYWDVSLSYNNSDMDSSKNGLVSYWHLDSNNGTINYTADAVGTNNGKCTNMGSDCNFTSGVYNNSASFDGDGDYVDMGTSSSLELDGEFTLSAWINSNTNSELRTIAGKVYYGSGAKEWGLYLSSTGVIQSKIGNGTDVIIAQSDTAIDTQRWYHTVVTRNSSGYIILYMDGIAQSDTEILTGDINPNYHFYISRRASADTFHFNGSIDEVMVFNRSLSDDEIKELYVKGRANWNYTAYQNLSNNGNIFNMSLSTTNLLTDFLMNAGNSTSNAFYTPNLGSGNITLDTMPPTYTLISPLNNSNFNNSNVNFTLNLSDNDGLLNATLNIYNSTGLVNQTVFTYVAGTLSATISVIINLIDNVYTWFLELWDVNGNQVFTPNQTFLVDTVYPNLNIISPTSYTNNNTIQLNTSDNYQHSSFIDLDKSLLNYLPFDKINGSGDPTDLSSYLNNGSLVNARITGDGYYGSGANFTGATDKIVIPNTGSLNFNTSNSYTWSMWAKYDTSVCSAVQATSCTLFSQSNGTTGGFYVFLYGSTIYFDDGFSTFTSPISDIVSNQWNHLVFIYNGTNLIGYLNGIKSSTVSIDSLSRNLTGNFVIGNGTGNAVYGLQGMVGQIDEFMIFNRSLSESEINSSFNSTAYQYLNNFSLSQNNHTLTAYAIDKGGNINSSYLNFTYDTINPQINITFPINNSWYNYNTVNINFTRSDTNLDSCWYSNDTYSSNTTLANCNNLTTIIWSQGNHNVTIWANDSAGNTNSSSITFNVDITNPLINFTSPTESSGVSKLQDFVYINTTWTETNFKNITFNIYNNTGLVNSTNYLTSVYLINFTNLTDNFNLYFYNVTICDLANNCNYTQTRNITLFNDNIAPSVLLVSPEDNSQDNDGVIRFIFNANDTNDIKNCSIYLQNTIYSTFYNITKNTNLLYEAVNTGDNPNINSNSLKWYVSCTDQYNNIGNSSIFNLDTFVQRQSSSDQTGGIGTSVIELNPKLVEIFYSTIWYTGEEQTIQIKTLNLNGIPYYVNNITFSSDIQNIKLIDLTNKENMTLVRFFVDENTKEGDYKINIKATDEKMLEKTAEISIKNKDSNIGKSPIIDFSSINNLLWIIIILLVIFSIIIIIILSVYFDKKRRISR